MNQMTNAEFEYYLWNPLEYKRRQLKIITNWLEKKYGKKAKRYNSIEEFSKDLKNVKEGSIIVVDEVSAFV